ncbi:MAG: hypothetical protein HUN04_20970 [Desulfobacter sp.]|nr:MAG: hypothetical protein HUN04_20970 [Desulfobacter sp.]
MSLHVFLKILDQNPIFILMSEKNGFISETLYQTSFALIKDLSAKQQFVAILMDIPHPHNLQKPDIRFGLPNQYYWRYSGFLLVVARLI